jgi:hypothetical protein
MKDGTRAKKSRVQDQANAVFNENCLISWRMQFNIKLLSNSNNKFTMMLQAALALHNLQYNISDRQIL